MVASYTLAVGTHDPYQIAAGTDDDAVAQAVQHAAAQFGDELRTNPQEVVTLLGPGGLVTRSGERLDEFVRRTGHSLDDGGTLLPGDSNSPDCNGD